MSRKKDERVVFALQRQLQQNKVLLVAMMRRLFPTSNYVKWFSNRFYGTIFASQAAEAVHSVIRFIVKYPSTFFTPHFLVLAIGRVTKSSDIVLQDLRRNGSQMQSDILFLTRFSIGNQKSD